MATVLTSTLSAAASEARQHTSEPIVTGTSVLAVVYKGGVMMAADTLGSYGSLARFLDVERVVKANDSTLVGADGEISDFQQIQKILKELEDTDRCVADGITHSPREVWSCLTRIMYHRRSKMQPLWNNLVVAGFRDGQPFLGTTDKIGTSYECDFVATGLGMHMALPIMRTRWSKDMSEADARALLEDCMRVLFYRDCRTINKISFATVSSAGPKVNAPVALSTEWNYKSFVSAGK